MDTVSHSSDDSLASVENHPVNVDDPNFPSSNFMNPDLKTSEFNYSNYDSRVLASNQLLQELKEKQWSAAQMMERK